MVKMTARVRRASDDASAETTSGEASVAVMSAFGLAAPK